MMRCAPKESEIQSAVIKHWRFFGRPHTLVAAIPNAKAHGQAGLTPGLPDLLVIGGNVRIAFLELKSSRGKLRPAQGVFMNLCAFAGIAHAVTYDRDEPIRVLDRWGVLRPNYQAPLPAPRDEASEIRALAADGMSTKLISIAHGISVEGVEAILAGARP